MKSIPNPPAGLEAETPIISLAGDRPETLSDQYETARRALMEAVEAMADAMPHGRNFIGKEYAPAREAHEKRIKNLREMAGDMDKLAEYCAAFIK
jgi:hypothetical protein